MSFAIHLSTERRAERWVAFHAQRSHTARRNFMSLFIAGQRWMSESEPELGLGTVTQAGGGRVQVAFPATGEPGASRSEASKCAAAALSM